MVLPQITVWSILSANVLMDEPEFSAVCGPRLKTRLVHSTNKFAAAKFKADDNSREYSANRISPDSPRRNSSTWWSIAFSHKNSRHGVFINNSPLVIQTQ